MRPVSTTKTKKYQKSTPQPGDLIDNRYLVKEILGEGGIGTVLQVSDQLKNDEQIALKVIRQDVLSQEIRKRFTKEFRLLRLLKHPGVVNCYDFGYCKRHGEYFTMENVEWPTLSSLNDPLPTEDIIRLLYNIANVLSFVHNHQITHFDLKPNNIFVDFKNLSVEDSLDLPLIKIGDFGLAGKRVSKDPGDRFITLDYSAPEMFQTGKVDSRADIFSLAMVGYILLRGASPYTDQSYKPFLSQKLNWLPDQSEWLRPDIPDELTVLLTRCLNSNPAFRPRNASEVISAITRMIPNKVTEYGSLATPPFIGRIGEKRLLGSRLHEVSEGEQWAILLYGEAEAGKSRLIDEFALQQQLQGKIIIRLDGNDLTPLALHLSHLRNLDISNSQYIDAEDVWRLLSNFMKKWQSSNPIIICWHNFDSASQANIRKFKSFLLKHSQFPLFWLLESKENHTELSSLSFSDHLVRHEIPQFECPQVQEFISALLNNATGSEVLGKSMFDLIGGRPGWLLQVLRQLIARKYVIMQDSHWYIINPDIIDSIRDVAELLKVDLKKLSLPSRWVVEWLAVLNRKCEIETIKAELELAPSAWTEVIEETTKNGLLEISQDQVSFRLPVLREITYQSLSPSKRGQLHFWLGRWHEEQNPPINDIEALTTILNHYSISNKTTSFLRIIERILGAGANGHEFQLDSNILESALSIEEFPLSTINRYRCLEMLGIAFQKEKRFEESVEVFKRLVEGEEWKEFAHYGFIHLNLGSSLGSIGRFQEASIELEKGYQELLDSNIEAACRSVGGLTWVLYQHGNVEKSREFADQYCKLTEKISPTQAQNPHLLACGRLLALHNCHEGAFDHYQQVIDNSETPWESQTVINAYRRQIELRILKGEWKEAVKSIDFIEKNKPITGSKEFNWFNSYLRAMTMIVSGQVEEGLNLFEKIELYMKAYARPLDQIRILLDLIRIDYHCGNYFNGMHRIRTSMGIARRLDATHMVVIIRTWATLFRDMMGKSTQKLIDNTEALNHRIKNTISDCVSSYLLGQHYLNVSDYDRASTMLERSLKNLQNVEFGISEPLLRVMKVQADIALGNKTINSIDFEEFEQMSSKIKHFLSRGLFFQNLLQLAVMTDHRDLATRYLQDSISNFRKMSANYQVGQSLDIYAKACTKWNLTKRANQAFKQSQEIFAGLSIPSVKTMSIESATTDEGDDIVMFDKVPPIREIAKVIDMLNTMEDPERLTRRLLKMAIEGVGAERGLIMFRREKTPGLSRKASIRVGQKEELSISRTLAEQVFKTGEPIFSDNALDDSVLNTMESVQLSKIRAVACMPIISKGETAGVLYLDHGGSSRKMTEGNRAYLTLLGNLIGTVLTHRRYIENLEENVKTLRKSIDLIAGYDEFKGRSEAIQKVFSLLELLKDQDIPVLILGESGTGKELISRIIQRESNRSTQPFYAINCATIQDTLIESMLFGHKKGSFTGANADHSGFFEQADNGTIFLDEVDKMSESMQGKLLRVLQEGEFFRVGETKVRKTNVRLITAAKDSLPDIVSSGAFREDLFYRINVVQIKVPPLRNRVDDISLLTNHFIDKFSKEQNRPIEGIRKSAELILQKYNWPGNVRQLENVIRGVFLYTKENGWIEPEFLPEEITSILLPDEEQRETFSKMVAAYEQKILKQTLIQCNWNKSEVSRRLDISRPTLIQKIKKYNIAE
ncbi:MAG: sigma 54-interacting transcriptional regulator [Calditrichaeota bacterium]|nr:sigma 54-interacting transcriptional regulator [Calditrichota bacterium]